LRPQFEKRWESAMRALFFSICGAENETRTGKFFLLATMPVTAPQN
jgi:hypothetical protein